MLCGRPKTFAAILSPFQTLNPPSLQANCGIPEGGKGNFTLAVQAAVLGDWGVIKHQKGHLSQWTKTYVIQNSTAIEGGCYLTRSSLNVDPPIPKEKTHLKFEFRPSMHLNGGDNV